MENFVLPQGTDTLRDSRELINNALLTVRSLSCGTSFPTDNLTEGMLCYRTDQGKLYQYTASGTWSDTISLQANSATNDSYGNKLNASNYATLDSTQTVAGQKTFTAMPVLSTGCLIPVIDSVKFYNGTPNKIVATLSGTQYSGNANTATSAGKLTTAVKINGVSFDGSTDVSIDSGVMTVNGEAPDENGDITIVATTVGVKVWD